MHGERDHQLRVRLLAGMRRRRVPIALRSQVLFDAVARVLEQILVHRPFALDRHELDASVRRQRVPREHDAHARARRHRQRQVGDAIAVGQAHDRQNLRFVVTAFATGVDVPLDACIERLALIRRAGREAKAVEELGVRHRRRSDDLDRADLRPHARIDREDQGGALGRVLDVRSRRDGGVQVSALAQRVGKNARHVRGPAERRRDAEPVDDGAAQRTLVDAGRTERAVEADAGDGMQRHQLVGERDAAVLDRRIDADALESPEAEEVRHRLAHLHHRQRLAGRGPDDLHHQRLGRVAPFDHEAN